MARRVYSLIVALMVAATALVAGGAPARADNASSLLSLVNALRAAHGEAALVTDSTLTGDAQAWSKHMASGAGLSDDPNLASEVAPGWTGLAENAGEGGNIEAIFNALVKSPIHLENMLDSAYNLTGVAVVGGAGNSLWVTEDFEARPGATPTATTAPPAATTTIQPPTHATGDTGGATPTTVPRATRVTTPTITPALTPTPTPGPNTGAVISGGGQPFVDPTTTVAVPVLSQLAVDANSSRPGGSAGSLNGLVLALSALGLALAVIAGSAYVMGRARRT